MILALEYFGRLVPDEVFARVSISTCRVLIKAWGVAMAPRQHLASCRLCLLERMGDVKCEALRRFSRTILLQCVLSGGCGWVWLMWQCNKSGILVKPRYNKLSRSKMMVLFQITLPGDLNKP